MKKAVLFFCIVSIFCFSTIGYRLFHRIEEKSEPYAVLVRASLQDNALVALMQSGAYSATIDGAAATITDFAVHPSCIAQTEDGAYRTFSSALYSDVLFSLLVDAEQRDGVCYTASVLLAPGKKILLSSSLFHGYVEILAVNREHEAKNMQKIRQK